MPGGFEMYYWINITSGDMKQNKNKAKFRIEQYYSSVSKNLNLHSRWQPLFGIPGRVNFVCLNAHHDENASYSTCSLIRKAVQMAFFDRGLINPAILWEEKETS